MNTNLLPKLLLPPAATRQVVTTVYRNDIQNMRNVCDVQTGLKIREISEKICVFNLKETVKRLCASTGT